MKLFYLLLIILFVPFSRVHAYLDPGSGSYLFQILIGVFLGGAYLIKTFWRDIKKKITSRFKKKTVRDEDR